MNELVDGYGWMNEWMCVCVIGGVGGIGLIGLIGSVGSMVGSGRIGTIVIHSHINTNTHEWVWMDEWTYG